jgi:hypothetical protein
MKRFNGVKDAGASHAHLVAADDRLHSCCLFAAHRFLLDRVMKYVSGTAHQRRYHRLRMLTGIAARQVLCSPRIDIAYSKTWCVVP